MYVQVCIERRTLTGSLNLPAMHFTSPLESSPSGQRSIHYVKILYRENSRQKKCTFPNTGQLWESDISSAAIPSQNPYQA